MDTDVTSKISEIKEYYYDYCYGSYKNCKKPQYTKYFFDKNYYKSDYFLISVIFYYCYYTLFNIIIEKWGLFFLNFHILNHELKIIFFFSYY